VVKENEVNDLKLFLALLGDINESECEFTDEPDQVPDLRVPDRSLGVEHTRFYHCNPTIPKGRQKLPQEKLHWQLLQQANQIFRQHSDQLLNLHAMFSEPFDSRKHHLDHEAHVLAQSVLAVLSRYTASETDPVYMRSWQTQRLGLPFPKSLDAYVYNRVRTPGMALWAPGYSSMVPSLTVERVKTRIREKEGHLAEYRTRCHTIWLLMVTDAGTPSSHLDITDELKQYRFTTLFDRLWLLLPFPRQLIELQAVVAGAGDVEEL
jgi:hypothetical protein